jgi:hypothetical protein
MYLKTGQTGQCQAANQTVQCYSQLTPNMVNSAETITKITETQPSSTTNVPQTVSLLPQQSYQCTAPEQKIQCQASPNYAVASLTPTTQMNQFSSGYPYSTMNLGAPNPYPNGAYSSGMYANSSYPNATYPSTTYANSMYPTSSSYPNSTYYENASVPQSGACPFSTCQNLSALMQNFSSKLVNIETKLGMPIN